MAYSLVRPVLASVPFLILFFLDALGGIALRGLFLIDPAGNVRHSVVNDLPVGRSPEEVILYDSYNMSHHLYEL